MSRRPRRNHGAEFKARVALAAIRGEKTLSELAEQFDVHPHQVTQWKQQLLERAVEAFDGPRHKDEPPVDVKAMQAKMRNSIGVRWTFPPLRVAVRASRSMIASSSVRIFLPGPKRTAWRSAARTQKGS